MINSLLNWWRDRRELKTLAKNRANAPTTLDEAVDRMISQMSKEDVEDFIRQGADCPGAHYHHGHGTWLRNNWDLWGNESPLSKWFYANGIWHGDDRSTTIYKALYCRLTNTPFDIKSEAAHYEKFWRESACLGFDGVEIPGCKRPTRMTVNIDEDGKHTREYHYD